MRNKGWYVTITQIENEKIKNPMLISIYYAIKSYCANGRREYDISIRDIKSRSFLSLGTISKNLPEIISKQFVLVTGEKSRRGGMVRTYRCLLAEQLFKESVQNSSLSVQGEASNHLQINKVLRKKYS